MSASTSPATTPVDSSTARTPPARTLCRRPATQARLSGLRRELARITPVPCTAVDAHREIVDAMIRARLGGWTLPALDGSAALSHADGSLSIPLISHLVVLNPWGAFRIVDCMRPAVAYFEQVGCQGRGFRRPSPEVGDAKPGEVAAGP